jgi:hypothetical protein
MGHLRFLFSCDEEILTGFGCNHSDFLCARAVGHSPQRGIGSGTK